MQRVVAAFDSCGRICFSAESEATRHGSCHIMDIKEETKKGAVSRVVINVELLTPWPNGLVGRRKLKT